MSFGEPPMVLGGRPKRLGGAANSIRGPPNCLGGADEFRHDGKVHRRTPIMMGQPAMDWGEPAKAVDGRL